MGVASTQRKNRNSRTGSIHTRQSSAPAAAALQKQSRSVRSGKNEKLSTYIQPMFAQIHDQPFDDADWLFEVKWDGYRAIAEVNHGDVKLYSRNGLSFLSLYPKVAEALRKLKHEIVLDGEIVVFNDSNKPDFQKLQQYGGGTGVIAYNVFDCLALDGRSLVHLPLKERKEILKKVVGKNSVIRYSEHVEGTGKEFFKTVTSMDLEGMIAKRADSVYHAGKRTGDWLKIKNHNTQEAIIAGYTPPKGSRSHIGSLVLAIREKDHYKYIGHTGTGFTNAALTELHKKLQPLVTATAPFNDRIPLHSKVTWVKPELVCNVKFTEITSDGILRHPVYQGLRIDKEANDVTVIDKPIAKREKQIQETLPPKPKNDKETVTVNGKKLTITNVDKIYWPGEKLTKGDLLTYYQTISKWILPYLKDRPQSLKRNPNGITNPGFFQKEAGDHIPAWLRTVPLRAESANRTIDYILCNDAATLLYLNNLGCIELNPWSSRVQKPDHPDYLAFDLDPSDKNSFDDVIEAALSVRNILERIGAECYCKTSGASGLHVYVPLKAKYTYEEVMEFAEAVALRVASVLPKTTTTERTISKRKDRIYLDYMQNRKGQTVASVYCVRPKPGAPVSTPLLWDEVKPGLHPSQFTIQNVPQRLEKTGDLFSPILKNSIDLKKCLKKLHTLTYE
jgi:bifunctional non-homologous end joining protein LigD